MRQKLEQNKLLFIIINVIAFVIFLWLNTITELSGDDLDYQKIFWTEERAQSIQDVFVSQMRHYMLWGGRSVVHFIDQIFLMYDKVYFNVASAVVFLVFVLTIYYMSFRKKVSNSFLILVYVLICMTIPNPMHTIVWQTSSVNYLWGTTFILLFILPFYIVGQEKRTDKSKPYYTILASVLMFLFGVISGWTLEAGGAMLLLTVSLIMGYQWYRKSKVRLWEITGFCGAIIGFALLILAPGNYARAEIVVNSETQRGLLAELLFRVARETYYMLVHMWSLFVVLFILLLFVNKRKCGYKMGYKKVFLFLSTSFVGVYVMTASPAYSERVLVTPIAFALVAVGLLYNMALTGIEKEKW